jgi:hypothetical protein
VPISAPIGDKEDATGGSVAALDNSDFGKKEVSPPWGERIGLARIIRIQRTNAPLTRLGSVSLNKASAMRPRRYPGYFRIPVSLS